MSTPAITLIPSLVRPCAPRHADAVAARPAVSPRRCRSARRRAQAAAVPGAERLRPGAGAGGRGRGDRRFQRDPGLSGQALPGPGPLAARGCAGRRRRAALALGGCRTAGLGTERGAAGHAVRRARSRRRGAGAHPCAAGRDGHRAGSPRLAGREAATIADVACYAYVALAPEGNVSLQDYRASAPGWRGSRRCRASCPWSFPTSACGPPERARLRQ